MTKRFYPIVAGFALLCCALPVFAASLTISSSGSGGFVLHGNGMDNVAALDITITYDTATLANPQVTSGGLITGALTAVNPNVPGTVRMGIITTSPIKGDGIIATLAFDQVGNSPGGITAIKANITNSNGNPLPVQAQIINPPNETVIAPPNAGTQSGTTPSPAASTPEGGRQIVIGGGIVPSDDSAASAKKEPAPAPEAMPESVKEKGMVSQETVSSATGTIQSTQPTGQNKKIYSQKSILERFREYKGERSVKALTELFSQEPAFGFRQDPAIVLSDGKATVKISFIAMSVGKKTPDVKLRGASLLSLKKDPDNTNTWIAELRPEKKAVSAMLVVSREKVNMEFPIFVAPEANVDLDKSGEETEDDFKVFLRDRGAAQKPLFDLNNDGKRDFVDDYIFTANYLVRKQTEAKQQTNQKLR